MVQDEAAMLAAILMNPKAGWKVLDVCSAPGGKACHMAEKMGDKGRILALDINESRLQMVEENQARLGLTCIDTALADALILSEELAEYKGYYNAVLADAPCSGLGLLLRKPDIRHTMTYEKMNDLLTVQETILDQAALFVRPGGTLMYSTCTINPHENDGQADAFLAKHENFEEYPFDDILPGKTVLRTEAHLAEAKHGRLKLLPDEDGCDGFYIARFRRKE
jgi:16S rRNA (cytosine967-C5)-methyltransferase